MIKRIRLSTRTMVFFKKGNHHALVENLVFLVRIVLFSLGQSRLECAGTIVPTKRGNFITRPTMNGGLAVLETIPGS